MTDPTPKPGPKIERTARLRWVALSRIRVSDIAQRELKQYRVDHLIAHFDPEQIAVGTLRRVYLRSGAHVLGRTLRIIDSSWGTAGLEAHVIDGIGLLCGRYNGELEDALIVAKLRNMRGGVKGFMGKAALIRETVKQPLNQCVAAAAVDVMNAGKGGKKLPGWWRDAA
jgi:hypothetical protein